MSIIPLITIDGYLIQRKLEEALCTIVGEGCWRGREINVFGTRKRWDMAYEVDGMTTVVEFDGDEHYRNSLKIKDDRTKDGIAAASGIRVVRFPYWVQLTTETVLHYFGIRAIVRQNFPHGFITTKIFPASFCELGACRFAKELEELPSSVQTAVLTSLRDRAVEYGVGYVLPSSLQHYI